MLSQKALALTAFPRRPNPPPAGGRPLSNRAGGGSRWPRARPICPCPLEGHHATGVPAGAASTHHTRACEPSTSSVPLLPVPSVVESPGPKGPEKKALGSAVAGVFRSPTPGALSLSQSAPGCPAAASRPRSRGSLARSRPGQGADGPAGASHAVAAPQPSARPGPRPLGRRGVGGVRRERAPRRAPPSGPAGAGPGKAAIH